MNWKLLYLYVNIFTISIPLISSFYPKSNFSKKWKYFFPAVMITGSVFIIWDIFFTKWEIWGFNSNYLSGITLINLPIEEWLFFITIPYSCVFTYEAVKYFAKRQPLKDIAEPIAVSLGVVLIIIGLFNLEKWYTSTTFIATGAFLLVQVLVFRPAYLGHFLLTYLIILLPFLLVNGVLTGTAIQDKIVWYNDSKNLGIRIGTIPIEDAIYGMLLIFMNVSIFEWLQTNDLRINKRRIEPT